MRVRLSLLAGLAAALLMVAPVAGAQGVAHPVDPNTPVSGDGSVVAVGAMAETAPSGLTHTSSFRGRGLANAVLDPPNGRSGPPPATPRTAVAKSAGGTIGIESLIGPDGRVRVNPTTSYPARATALITFKSGGASYFCSGWFIGKDTVVTAGHCVADGGSGRLNAASSYRVYPGQNGSSSPYGNCAVKRLHTVTGWLNSGDWNYDYGALKLKCSVGNTVGWYGMFWQADSPTGTPATVQGYPGDKPYRTQWTASGAIGTATATKLWYDMDTYGGQSGSPVWTNHDVSCPVCAMAVHAYGGSTANSGTRITQAVFDNLVAWKNAA